jgi:glutamine synthetase
MHVNMSLSTLDGKNAFADPKGDRGLSDIAYSYIAGLLEHVKSFTAVTNPLVNSYKRLVPGYEAPCYMAWSTSNRSTLIRIPASRGSGTRIELRSPDPSANPYLALACCLTAGLEGIKKGMAPPKSVDANIFDMTAAERTAAGVDSLPGNLYEAVKTLEKDDLMKKALGEHIFEKYTEAKLAEWDSFRTAVTEWEINNYLA